MRIFAFEVTTVSSMGNKPKKTNIFNFLMVLVHIFDGLFGHTEFGVYFLSTRLLLLDRIGAVGQFGENL